MVKENETTENPKTCTKCLLSKICCMKPNTDAYVASSSARNTLVDNEEDGEIVLAKLALKKIKRSQHAQPVEDIPPRQRLISVITVATSVSMTPKEFVNTATAPLSDSTILSLNETTDAQTSALLMPKEFRDGACGSDSLRILDDEDEEEVTTVMDLMREVSSTYSARTSKIQSDFKPHPDSFIVECGKSAKNDPEPLERILSKPSKITFADQEPPMPYPVPDRLSCQDFGCQKPSDMCRLSNLPPPLSQPPPLQPLPLQPLPLPSQPPQVLVGPAFTNIPPEIEELLISLRTCPVTKNRCSNRCPRTNTIQQLFPNQPAPQTQTFVVNNLEKATSVSGGLTSNASNVSVGKNKSSRSQIEIVKPESSDTSKKSCCGGKKSKAAKKSDSKNSVLDENISNGSDKPFPAGDGGDQLYGITGEIKICLGGPNKTMIHYPLVDDRPCGVSGTGLEGTYVQTQNPLMPTGQDIGNIPALRTQSVQWNGPSATSQAASDPRFGLKKTQLRICLCGGQEPIIQPCEAFSGPSAGLSPLSPPSPPPPPSQLPVGNQPTVVLQGCTCDQKMPGVNCAPGYQETKTTNTAMQAIVPTTTTAASGAPHITGCQVETGTTYETSRGTSYSQTRYQHICLCGQEIKVCCGSRGPLTEQPEKKQMAEEDAGDQKANANSRDVNVVPVNGGKANVNSRHVNGMPANGKRKSVDTGSARADQKNGYKKPPVQQPIYGNEIGNAPYNQFPVSSPTQSVDPSAVRKEINGNRTPTADIQNRENDLLIEGDLLPDNLSITPPENLDLGFMMDQDVGYYLKPIPVKTVQGEQLYVDANVRATHRTSAYPRSVKGARYGTVPYGRSQDNRMKWKIVLYPSEEEQRDKRYVDSFRMEQPMHYIRRSAR